MIIKKISQVLKVAMKTMIN